MNDLGYIEIYVVILEVFEIRVGGRKNGCSHIFWVFFVCLFLGGKS